MKIRKKDRKAAAQTSSLPKHILVSKQTLLQCIGLHAHCTAFEFQQVGFSRLAAGEIVSIDDNREIKDSLYCVGFQQAGSRTYWVLSSKDPYTYIYIYTCDMLCWTLNPKAGRQGPEHASKH